MISLHGEIHRPNRNHRKLVNIAGIVVVVSILLVSSSFSVDGGRYQTVGGNDLLPFSGPLRVSPINPRYFTDDTGRAILLSGSHTWANFQDIGPAYPPASFDYSTYLDFLHANHHNFFRLWTWEQSKWVVVFSDPYYFSPMPYLRTGPGNAEDGRLRFDLDQFDQSYFDRMRDRIVQAGNQGIYVSIMLFDGWSISYPKSTDDSANPWQTHPYNSNNNINDIDGDLDGNNSGDEVHTLQIAAITALQERYVAKVIDTVNDLDNVLYEISNESHSDSQDWQMHLVNYIKTYEAAKPKQHPVGMTVEYPGGNNAELFNSPADWISPNEVGGYKDSPPVADGSKIVINDTDHLWGSIGGDHQWAWKSFMRGMHPIFMDCYNDDFCLGYDPNDLERVNLRLNLGYILDYANRINLLAMSPQAILCSTGYCLVYSAETGAEYLVYLPDGGAIQVDLSGSPGNLSVEWFDPKVGVAVDDEVVTGGDILDFTAPFPGDAVLFIYDAGLTVPTPMPTNTTAPFTPTPIGGEPTSSSTPSSPGQSLPCVSGLLILNGALGMMIHSGYRRKRDAH